MPEKLFILTAGSDEAYRHYIDTIEEGFNLENIKQFLSEKEYEIINALYGDRKIRAWGALSGPVNKRNWEKLEADDKIVIYRKRNYEYVARVTYKFHNSELVKHLWSTNTDEATIWVG